MERILEQSASPTALLLAWGRGEMAAFDRLVPPVHDELRRLARRYMSREHPGHTLQATALVNEAYLRPIDVKEVPWLNRAHFFAMSARMMRPILVDSARARGNEKRAAASRRSHWTRTSLCLREADSNLVALDVSPDTVKRDWRFATLWLLRERGGARPDGA